MNLKYSRHARRQMKWRMITEEEIITVISNPDRIEDSIKDRKNAFKMLEDRWLKITYAYVNEEIIVITAMVKEGHK
jgi:hypothetical protein